MSKTLKFQLFLITFTVFLLGFACGLYAASRFIGEFVPELAK